jgi:3-oxoacyl-[acyl-carrier-protein] synthase II
MSSGGKGKDREVVITGMGLMTPLGLGVEENWEKVKALKTGIGHYPREGLPGFLQHMGKVRAFEAEKDIPHKLLGQMRFLNRGSILGFAAAREAVSLSGMNVGAIPPGRRALYIASGDTTKVGYDFLYPAIKDGTHGTWQDMNFETLNRSTLDKVSPFFLLESILNNLFSFLSAFYELMGPNTSLASHSPLGGSALELACRSIQYGTADIAIAVGCGNWITEIPLYEMEGLGILSQCRQGIHSYRPFDRKRDGFIPGEGGAALLLEASEVAEQRGARGWAKIRGFGNCIEFSDDRSITVPPRVSARSMRSALEDAGCDLADLAFICPHGSGSRKGDRSELNSIREVWGPGRQKIPISGMKSYTGHLGAASDLAEIILGIRSTADRMVPGTLNFEEADLEFSDLQIRGTHQRCEGHHFLSTSYGIGGQSSSVVLQVL